MLILETGPGPAEWSPWTVVEKFIALWRDSSGKGASRLRSQPTSVGFVSVARGFSPWCPFPHRERAGAKRRLRASWSFSPHRSVCFTAVPRGPHPQPFSLGEKGARLTANVETPGRGFSSGLDDAADKTKAARVGRLITSGGRGFSSDLGRNRWRFHLSSSGRGRRVRHSRGQTEFSSQGAGEAVAF